MADDLGSPREEDQTASADQIGEMLRPIGHCVINKVDAIALAGGKKQFHYTLTAAAFSANGNTLYMPIVCLFLTLAFFSWRWKVVYVTAIFITIAAIFLPSVIFYLLYLKCYVCISMHAIGVNAMLVMAWSSKQ